MAASSPSGVEVPFSQARRVSSVMPHASATCHGVSSNFSRSLARSTGGGRFGRGLAMKTSSESNRASTIASTPVRAAGRQGFHRKAFALRFTAQHHMERFFYSSDGKTVRLALTCGEGHRLVAKNSSNE